MGISPVYIDFAVRNVPEVERAFKNVSDAVVRSERTMTRTAQQGVRERLRVANQEAQDKVRALKSGDREVARARNAGVREAEKAARAEVRAAEQAAKDRVRAYKSADREIARARNAGVRDFERSEREKNQAASRWVRQRETEQRRGRERMGNAIMGGAGRAASTIMRGATGAVGGLLQVGGGFGMVDSVQRELSLRGSAATLAASSVGNYSGSQVLAQARSVGNAQAMDPEFVIKGISAMKDLTGDLGGAMRTMPKLAKIATATGTDVGELGGQAGNIMMSNPTLSDDDLQKQLRVFARQSQIGGVEVKDMAKHGARFTAGASLFGGDKSENLATMGAFAQVARQYGGAASPAEAALAAQRFGTDIQKSADKLEKGGIKVRDGKGTLRDSKSIMMDMLDKSGGDVTQMKQFGLGERGTRVLSGFSEIYRTAGGGTKGRDAVKNELNKYTSGVKESEIEAANAKRLAETDAQVTIAMNQLRDAVGAQLVPVMKDFVPVLRDAVPHVQKVLSAFVGLAQWAERNPIAAAFAGLGAVLTRTIGAEIAGAKLGEFIKSMIAGGGSGAGAGLGKIGKAAAVVGTGVAAVELTKAWVDDGFATEGKNVSDRVGRQLQATNLISDAKHGKLTNEQRAQAQALVKQLGADSAQVGDELRSPSLVKKVTGAFGAVAGGKDFADAQKTDVEQQVRLQADLAKSQQALIDALNRNTTATSRDAGGGGGSTDPKNRATSITTRTTK